MSSDQRNTRSTRGPCLFNTYRCCHCCPNWPGSGRRIARFPEILDKMEPGPRSGCRVLLSRLGKGQYPRWLSALVTAGLGRDPRSGDGYLFANRSRTRAKVLRWDGTGLCIYAKRLVDVLGSPKGIPPACVRAPATRRTCAVGGPCLTGARSTSTT